MDINKVIKYPLTTEKAVKMIEAENKIIFIVDRRAKKEEIKMAIEKTFGAKVKKIRTLNDIHGNKKAYISLMPNTPAIDIATKIGVM